MAKKLKNILEILEEEKRGNVENERKRIDFDMVNLADLIEPVNIKCEGTKWEYQQLKTFQKNIDEKIYIGSTEDFRDQNMLYRVANPTDYSIYNGTEFPESKGNKTQGYYVPYYTRTMFKHENGEIRAGLITTLGDADITRLCDKRNGIRPMVNLNIDKFLSVYYEHQDLFDIHKVKHNIVSVWGTTETFKMYTILLGEYPQSFVGQNLNDELEKAYKNQTIKPTGKKIAALNYIIDPFYDDGTVYYNQEYEYKGEKYVRVSISMLDSRDQYSGPVNWGKYLWVKVEPIRWVIENWQDLPREINPDGTGRAKTIELQTEDCIMGGIPLCINNGEGGWENCFLRKFLNDYFFKEVFESNADLLTKKREKNITEIKIEKEMNEMIDDVDYQIDSL